VWGLILDQRKALSTSKLENIVLLKKEEKLKPSFRKTRTYLHELMMVLTLKAYKGDIIKHSILLKDGAKLFRHKQKHMNPKLASIIQKELKKMSEPKIIAPMRHSSRVANLVQVRKKNGEIRLSVDVRNLNQLSLRDDYSLLNVEHLLQKVIVSY
jgi:hypothetical protein